MVLYALVDDVGKREAKVDAGLKRWYLRYLLRTCKRASQCIVLCITVSMYLLGVFKRSEVHSACVGCWNHPVLAANPLKGRHLPVAATDLYLQRWRPGQCQLQVHHAVHGRCPDHNGAILTDSCIFHPTTSALPCSPIRVFSAARKKNSLAQATRPQPPRPPRRPPQSKIQNPMAQSRVGRWIHPQ